jgi:hypothetical protein
MEQHCALYGNGTRFDGSGIEAARVKLAGKGRCTANARKLGAATALAGREPQPRRPPAAELCFVCSSSGGLRAIFRSPLFFGWVRQKRSWVDSGRTMDSNTTAGI